MKREGLLALSFCINHAALVLVKEETGKRLLSFSQAVASLLNIMLALTDTLHLLYLAGVTVL